MQHRRLLTFRHTAVVLVVALIVGFLLAAQPLQQSAEGVSSPVLRKPVVAITKCFAAASRFLQLDKARQWVVRHDDAEQVGGVGSSVDADSQWFDESPTPTTLSTYVRAGGGDPAGQTPAPSTSRTVPADVGERKDEFDGEQRLCVLVVGDSLVGEIAKAMVRKSGKWPIRVEYRYKVSSGLVRRDFFDWPAEMKRLVSRFKPDVTVMMFGNNDHLRLMVDGKPAAIFSPEWTAEYQRRAQTVAGIAANAGSRVIWVGMPIMRSAKFSETARTLNGIYSRVCKSEGYVYLDAYKLFSDKAGKYAACLSDSSGKARLVRAGDGIHLTAAGGDRVAAEILRILRKYYSLQQSGG